VKPINTQVKIPHQRYPSNSWLTSRFHLVAQPIGQ
jgi:hypothetical protein